LFGIVINLIALEAVMKTKFYLLFSSLLISFFLAVSQSNAETLTETLVLPGWGVRGSFGNFIGTSTAFHFSPDGSFYEILDEGFSLRVGVKIKALTSITGAKIPIDAFCGVQVYVDGNQVANFVNQHRDVLVNFTPGDHNILIFNNCGSNSTNWMGIAIGKCLWGTNNAIKFVSTYMQ
jgi:hypothetical protein